MKKKSNSYLPNGGYTLTNGSNYMLDGFQYDTEYNGGVLEKARLPEAKGLASLPSGILPNDTPKASILPSHVDEEGGIYLDTDVVCIKSFDDLLDTNCIMGLEYTGKITWGLCDATILAEKNSEFMRLWKHNYDTNYAHDSWNTDAVVVPFDLAVFNA
mgnify:CR=1 FL=1